MATLDLAKGVLVAAMTPFVQGTTVIDFPKFERQCSLLRGSGVAAVIVGAVETQEFQALDVETRLALVDCAVAMLGDDTPVVAGVSAPDVQTSCVLASGSANRGAAAVLNIASLKPWGAPPTDAELTSWFGALADASPVPIGLYNNPRFGFDASVDVMVQIFQHENVQFLKETSRDSGKLLEMVEGIEAKGLGQVYTNMEMLLSTLVLGGSGAMLPFPGVPVALGIVDAWHQSDFERAVSLQMFFAHFPKRWMMLGLAPIAKAAARVIGCDLGDPMTPFSPLSPHAMESLERYLATWGLKDSLINSSTVHVVKEAPVG